MRHLNRKKRMEKRLDPNRFEPHFIKIDSIMREANKKKLNIGWQNNSHNLFVADNLVDAMKLPSWNRKKIVL